MYFSVSTSSLLVLVCCLLARTGTEGSQPPLAQEGERAGQVDQVAEGKGGGGQLEDKQTLKDNKEKFFLWAQYSTTTKFKLSFTTTSIPTTCISVFNTGECTGRRKKSFGRVGNFKVTMGGGNLDGSFSASDAVEDERADGNESEARKLLTVWSTSFSTKTATSWFINTSVTMKLSAACSIPGLVYPLCQG